MLPQEFDRLIVRADQFEMWMQNVDEITLGGQAMSESLNGCADQS